MVVQVGFVFCCGTNTIEMSVCTSTVRATTYYGAYFCNLWQLSWVFARLLYVGWLVSGDLQEWQPYYAWQNVRIFNSHAPSNCTLSSDACYRRHEREKRRAYEHRVLEVEHGTFTPLVLSTCKWRLGSICHGCLQETCRSHLWETWPTIQQHPQLHQM